MEANLLEVYESIDGEGKHAGRAVAIVRFAGCNLSCSYCDTPEAGFPREELVFWKGKDKIKLANPVNVNELVDLISRDYASGKRVMITGGEPLMQVNAAIAMANQLRFRGFKTCLETNGTLVEEMACARDAFDFISMDIKLPSSQGGKALWQRHEEFLDVLAGRPMAVKIVFGEEHLSEVFEALRLIARFNPHIPVFLQPIQIGQSIRVSSLKLVEMAREAGHLVSDVRISLQLHKFLELK